MATNAVNLGIGRASGMFYTAEEGTALPTTISALADWGTEVGYVSHDGITMHLAQDKETLKDWSNSIRRMLPSTDSGTVEVPVISTTAASLAAIFGDDNVTGMTVTVNPNNVQPARAWCLAMVDGDDFIIIGTTSGYVSDIADVTFQPEDAITWTATISADTWTITKGTAA